MKKFIQMRSRRYGYDGWAVAVVGSPVVFDWTTSTTRKEARVVKRDMEDTFNRHGEQLLDCKLEVVKVKVQVVRV